jgi:hypothetical protein
VIGAESEGGAVFGDGFRDEARAFEMPREEPVGLRIGAEREALAEGGDGGIELAFVAECLGMVAMRVGILRIESGGDGERGGGGKLEGLGGDAFKGPEKSCGGVAGEERIEGRLKACEILRVIKREGCVDRGGIGGEGGGGFAIFGMGGEDGLPEARGTGEIAFGSGGAGVLAGIINPEFRHTGYAFKQ